MDKVNTTVLLLCQFLEQSTVEHVKYIELNTFYEIIGEYETALTYTISQLTTALCIGDRLCIHDTRLR